MISLFQNILFSSSFIDAAEQQAEMLPQLPSRLSPYIPQDMLGERTVHINIYCHWLGEFLQEIPAFPFCDWPNALNNRYISSSVLLHHL
jgi:hypothetical protein